MAIRLRCPNLGFSHFVRAAVVESDVALVRPGDHVEFRTEEGRTTRGVLRLDGNEYPLDNVMLLPDEESDRFTLVEAELADGVGEEGEG